MLYSFFLVIQKQRVTIKCHILDIIWRHENFMIICNWGKKCDSIKVSHQLPGMKIGLGQMQTSSTKPLPPRMQIASLRRRILSTFQEMQRRAFFLWALAFRCISSIHPPWDSESWFWASASSRLAACSCPQQSLHIFVLRIFSISGTYSGRSLSW